MFDLVYPEEPAPLLKVKAVHGNTEVLPVVESTGLVIGRSTRKACHEYGLLHPVVHLQIVNHFGKIYLQKRSATKDLLPNHWDTAVGGHVSYGESLMEALVREAGEELGLFDFNPVYLKSYVYTNSCEAELVNIFALVTDRAINPDSDEVSEGRWWSTEEIELAAAHGTETEALTPQFEQEYADIRDSLLALI